MLPTPKEEKNVFPNADLSLHLTTPLPTTMATLSYCAIFTETVYAIHILKTKVTHSCAIFTSKVKNKHVFTKAIVIMESVYIVSTQSWISKNASSVIDPSFATRPVN